MGFADSPATVNALAGHGIRVSGYVWRWAPGQKGGIFPPHQDLNGQFEATADSYESWPGEDDNGTSCMCAVPPIYRTPDGRFAKPGLEPIFQPPVTASLEMPPIDWTPLTTFMTEWADRSQVVEVRLPDGAVIVNVPQQAPPTVNVESPTVQVDVAAPNVSVEAPDVTVEAPSVNVAAPEVTFSPVIDVKPAPVKIIREKVAKTLRFRRNANGLIESAEVTE